MWHTKQAKHIDGFVHKKDVTHVAPFTNMDWL